MTPPTMDGWNLTLRFGLELAALTGLASAAWTFTAGPLRWAAVVLAPIVAAAIWGLFNVLDDPSRSGGAPIEVSGSVRLIVELLILGGSAAAMAFTGRHGVATVFVGLIAFHYATSLSRIEWLLRA